MAASDIKEIDELLDGDGGPITARSDRAAIGAVQDLLRGHGHSKLPGMESNVYGKFGKMTKAALLAFCKTHCPSAVVNDEVKEVGKAALEALLSVPATRPIASRVYVTRKLGLDFTSYNRLSCLVAIGEGQGEFAVLCLNTDKAGLSVGMIQWAQKPLRLDQLLKSLPEQSLVAAFGSKVIAEKLNKHTSLVDEQKKISGGVFKATGEPEEKEMDLTRGDWPEKFRRLCRDVAVQKCQVTDAAKVFKADKVKFDEASPGDKSERLVAYLLDVGNQFGPKVARKFLKYAVDQGDLPSDLKKKGIELVKRITKLANDELRKIGETVKNGKRKWTEAFIHAVQKSRSNRGEFFGTWTDLSDEKFLE